MEPDCAFYVGERARCYRAALADGEAAAETFFERTPPDLVVEAEIASIDEGKIARYGEMGVRELGLTHEERTATVARIVRRRQRASVRVREEEAPYGTAPPDDDGTRAC